MKHFSILKIAMLVILIFSTIAVGQEKEQSNVDTLKFFVGEQKDVAKIELAVLSNNVFSFSMHILDDGTIIDTWGNWHEDDSIVEYTFDNKDFILSTLFDTTKYSADYSIKNDSTLTFDNSLWSINIWGIWCEDIIKTQ